MEAKMAKREEVEDGNAAVPLTVKEARAAILAGTKAKKAYVTFKGIELELRQPTVAEFLATQSNPTGEERSAAKMTIQLIVQYAYLKDTNDRIFEPTDVDVLVGMPMTSEVFQLIQKMNELLDIKVEENVKN